LGRSPRHPNCAAENQRFGAAGYSDVEKSPLFLSLSLLFGLRRIKINARDDPRYAPRNHNQSCAETLRFVEAHDSHRVPLRSRKLRLSNCHSQFAQQLIGGLHVRDDQKCGLPDCRYTIVSIGKQSVDELLRG
jgi:hypothetical protein